MKLPSFIPQVSRPWNANDNATWAAMTPNERRWSFLFDMLVVVVPLGIIIYGAS